MRKKGAFHIICAAEPLHATEYVIDQSTTRSDVYTNGSGVTLL